MVPGRMDLWRKARWRLLPGLALLGCCAGEPWGLLAQAAYEFPTEVAMNEGAGRGMFLFVKLRLETGPEFLCTIDTCAPGTLLSRSVEPALGKCLGTRKFSTLDAGPFTQRVYAAPKLYLGNTRLATGERIGTSEESPVLGMDCLRHYCVQLDFQARKVRFLNPETLNTSTLGKSFRLLPSHYTEFKHPGLFEKKTSELFVDTGCALDGYIPSAAFKRAAEIPLARQLPLSGFPAKLGRAPEFILVPEVVWDGEIYKNLIIGKENRVRLLGLKFLARHLVTLNFPRNVMYLKPITSEELLRTAGQHQ